MRKSPYGHTKEIVPKTPKKFKDKFIFIRTKYNFKSKTRLLMQYLSEIHLKYTSDECNVWIEEMGGINAGNYKLKSININASHNRQITTFTHEIGHYFDLNELANYKRSMSPISKQYRLLMRLLKNSVIAKSIKKGMKNPDFTDEEKEELKVYLTPWELFARSYEYYIYLKLGKEFDGILKPGFKKGKYFKLAGIYHDEYSDICDDFYSNYYETKIYWEDKKEFNEIYRAFDRLIRLINNNGIKSSYRYFEEIVEACDKDS